MAWDPVTHPMKSIKAVNPASVLVVEDEPLLRVYLSDVLGQSGFDVIVATNGEDPLALAKREDICAVVSDVDSVGDILYGHHAVKDLAEASAMALKAGNDECSGTSYRSLRSALDRVA